MSAARRCWPTWPPSPAARSSPRGRPQARQRHPRPARSGPQGGRHQGHHHHRRGRRQRGRREGPHRADQARDRRHRLRLGPREAPGAARQAGRRRRRREGRRRHRGGAQGEEAPHRGRPVGHPCRHRGGCGRRWRHRPAPGPRRRSPRWSRRSRATRPPAPGPCYRALEAPARLIADNAGLEGAVVVQQIERETGAIGLNAATGEFEDLLKAGVLDPAKVTRAALQNAASIAGLLLTTEALVADKPEDEPAMPAHAGRWHGRHGRHGRDDVVLEGRCLQLGDPRPAISFLFERLTTAASSSSRRASWRPHSTTFRGDVPRGRRRPELRPGRAVVDVHASSTAWRSAGSSASIRRRARRGARRLQLPHRSVLPQTRRRSSMTQRAHARRGATRPSGSPSSCSGSRTSRSSSTSTPTPTSTGTTPELRDRPGRPALGARRPTARSARPTGTERSRQSCGPGIGLAHASSPT